MFLRDICKSSFVRWAASVWRHCEQAPQRHISINGNCGAMSAHICCRFSTAWVKVRLCNFAVLFLFREPLENVSAYSGWWACTEQEVDIKVMLRAVRKPALDFYGP